MSRPACWCTTAARTSWWPSRSRPEDAANILQQHRELPDRFKNKLDAKDFLLQKMDKTKVKLSNLQLQIRDREVKLALVHFYSGRRWNFDDLPIDFALPLGWKVEEYLQAMNARFQELRSGATLAVLLPLPPPLLASLEDVPMVDPLAMVHPPPLVNGHAHANSVSRTKS